MEKIKKRRSARVTKRARRAKLAQEDGKGQQRPELASYQYSSLGVPTNIRVLEILPGKSDGQICFRLREKRLGDGDAYYALSYAWGPPVFTHKIYSAGGFIKVTENLWEALRRYRKADESITLWVDAICINQPNDQEKSHQIVLMRRIYSESKRVLIWLGLESLSDRSAFEFIGGIVDLVGKRGLDSVVELTDEVIPMLNDEDQDALTNLFEKSWFLRTWTFQEMSCAAQATFSSGSLDIEFDDLHIFCVFWKLSAFMGWLKSRTAKSAIYQIAIVGLKTDELSQQSAVKPLLELVQGTRTRLATDPRDKIYGLVALASDIDPLPFAPTYQVTVNHLYEEFAAHVIRQNGSLKVFECCTFQPAQKQCPSWVPDWRYSKTRTIPINQEKNSFRAAGMSCWDNSTAISDHSLGVDAICIDRLQNITSPEPQPNPPGLTDWENDYLPLFKWQQEIIRKTVEMTSLSLLYRSEQERWHAWWRTSIGERKNDLERATPDDEGRVRVAKDTVDAMANDDLDMVDFRSTDSQGIHKQMCAMMEYHRFGLTREGRIGWVPLAARTGDIVSLMRGSPVPVIIRRSQRRNSYLMVGQSYIHGIMDGEAVAGKEDEFRRIQLA